MILSSLLMLILCAVSVNSTLQRHLISGRCLDGSPAAYYTSKGLSDNTVIFLQGGGMCVTQEECQSRAKTGLGSSKAYPRELTNHAYGFLSRNPFQNPAFFDWSFVYVPYCTGDFYTGNETAPRSGLYYQGYLNFMTMLEELPQLKLKEDTKAKDIVLAGCSAGSVGAMLLVDSVAEKFPGMRVSSASTGGWLTTGKNCTGTHSRGKPDYYMILMRKAFNLWGEPFLPPACRSANAEQPWKCYDFSVVGPHIKSRVFIAETRFDIAQAVIIDGCPGNNKTALDSYFPYLAKLLAQSINSVNPSGVFLPSCQGHCQRTRAKINGVSLGHALSKWMKGESVKLEQGCTEVSCAPQC